MPEFNFIKNFNLIIKFGGNKKIEVASGKQSEGVLVLSSDLQTKAIDQSKNPIRLKSNQMSKKVRK